MIFSARVTGFKSCFHELWESRGRTLIVLFVVPFLFGFASGLSDRQIVENFDRIAFGNEFTKERFSRVRKWVDPIRFGIQGQYPDYFESDVMQHAQDLQQITGHPVSLYYSHGLQKKGTLAKDFDKKNVNVLLFYLPNDKIPGALLKYFDHNREDLQQKIKTSTCFARYFRRKNEIRGAVVVFPSHHSRQVMRACVVEELAQIMGLPNDSNAVEPSIFNDTSPYLELTEQDRLLLKILYNPQITFNMEREQALQKALEILPALRDQSN
ncbi:MAG: DUF2927 domain-containing protein [Magnetococcales bacterium]|nr:DUF2927 domain-containing protein [Magnetococcales bacterium]